MHETAAVNGATPIPVASVNGHADVRRELAPERFNEPVSALQEPFDPSEIKWRVTNMAQINSRKGPRWRGQMIAYADPRAYTDRLNELFTPSGWTRAGHPALALPSRFDAGGRVVGTLGGCFLRSLPSPRVRKSWTPGSLLSKFIWSTQATCPSVPPSSLHAGCTSLRRQRPQTLAIPPICDETLEPPRTPSRVQPGDVVGIGIHTGNALRGYAIGRLFRARGAWVMFGGIHATLYPEEAFELGGAHAVVKGDGDVIWGEALNDCHARTPRRESIEGGRVDAGHFKAARWDLLPQGSPTCGPRCRPCGAVPSIAPSVRSGAPMDRSRGNAPTT